MTARITAFAVLALFIAAGAGAAAEHIAAANPDKVKVEFENAKVRVMRLSLAPHQKMKLHETGDIVTVPLTDFTVVFTDSAGKQKQVERTAGKAQWVPGGERSAEAGDKPVEAVLVEIKSPPAK